MHRCFSKLKYQEHVDDIVKMVGVGCICLVPTLLRWHHIVVGVPNVATEKPETYTPWFILKGSWNPLCHYRDDADSRLLPRHYFAVPCPALIP